MSSYSTKYRREHPEWRDCHLNDYGLGNLDFFLEQLLSGVIGMDIGFPMRIQKYIHLD